MKQDSRRRVCDITGKSSLVGNRVSHAKNRTKVRLKANLHKKRYYVPKLKQFITLRVSAQGMRSINKNGIDSYIVVD